MSIYTQLWLVWGGFFLAVEGAAILSKTPGSTLTAHIVSWASLKEKSNGWLVRRGVLATFFGWLLWHFMSRTNF